MQDVEPYRESETAIAVRRATGNLLKMLNKDSETSQFLNAVQTLHGSTDGPLRVSDMFVALAEGKGLLLSKEENDLLKKQMEPRLNRRAFLKAGTKAAAGASALVGLNTMMSNDIERLNHEYTERTSKGYSALSVGLQRGNATAGQMIVNALGIPALIGMVAYDLMAATDGEKVTAADMQNKVGKMEKAMDTMLVEVASHAPDNLKHVR